MQRRDLLRALETGLLIAVGGAAGANLRYAIGVVMPGLRGTFVANVTGSFLLGILVYEALHSDLLAERTRVVFGTGFLSSYTTYSTFALETATASRWLGLLNVVGSYALGFAAVVVARRLVRSLSRDAGGPTDG